MLEDEAAFSGATMLLKERQGDAPRQRGWGLGSLCGKCKRNKTHLGFLQQHNRNGDPLYDINPDQAASRRRSHWILWGKWQL